jgi:site-specific DNA recombinase
MAKLAFIYGRKSRDNADTLDSQIQACIQWCERNGIEYEVFAEEGSSSSEDWNREELQKMITRIKQLENNFVVCTEQTRICRTDDFPKFKKILRELDCLFVTADTGQVFNYNNPDDELVSDVLTAVGKNELSRTKIRLKRGIIQSAKKRNWVGKKVPAGYTYNKETKRLVLNSDQEIIRLMFDLYLDGVSTTDIEIKFKFENKITKHTKEPIKWTSATIARMLGNIAYVGHSLYGKTTDKKDEETGKRIITKTEVSQQILELNTHDPIITEEEWKRVQDIKAKRNTRPARLKVAKHTFSGLIRCAECEEVHSFQTSHHKDKKRIAACKTRNYNFNYTEYKMCSNGGCLLSNFETIFYAYFGKLADQLANYVEMIQVAAISNEKLQQKKEATNKAKEKTISTLTKQVKNIQRNAELGMYDEEELIEKAADLKKMKQQIKQLEAEVNEEEAADGKEELKHMEMILNNMKKFMNGELEGAAANEMLTDMIAAIYYKKEKVTLSEIQIKVILKPEYNELFNDIEEILTKVAG